MAFNLQQTDTAAIDGAKAMCSGLSLATIPVARQVTRNGAAGTGTPAVTIQLGAGNKAAVMFESAAGEPGIATWDAGNWVIRLNVTTANAQLSWRQAFVCRSDQNGINVSTIGSVTPVAISLGTTGVKTMTVSGASDIHNTTDRIYVVLGILNTDPSASQSFNFTPDQLIDTPLLVPTMESEDLPPVLLELIPPFAPAYTYDETGSPLLNFYSEQEDDWLKQREYLPWLAACAIDNEILPRSANFFLDEKLVLIAREALPWQAVIFSDDEISEPLLNFALLDDDALLTPVPIAVVGYPLQPQVATGDEVELHIGLLDDDSLFATATSATNWKLLSPATDDEAGAQPPANFFLEDDIDFKPVVSTVSYPAVIPFSDDEAEAQPPINFFLEPEGDLPLTTAVVTVTWQAAPFTDDEVRSTALDFGRDSEEFWTALNTASTWQPAVSIDEEVGPTPLILFVEPQDPYVVQTQAANWLRIDPILGEEIMRGRVAKFKDEEPLRPPLTQSVPWTAITFLDEEAVIQVMPPGLEDESVTIARQAVTWTATAFVDDEAWRTFTPEFEQDYRPVAEAVVWASTAFADDEILIPLSRFGLEDEHLAPAPTLPFIWTTPVNTDDEITFQLIGLEDEAVTYSITVQPSIWLPKPVLDDEIFGRVVVIGLEDEHAVITGVQAVSWSAVLFREEDPAPNPSNFFLEQLETEDAWIPPLEVVYRNSITYLDDEISSGLINFYSEQQDDYNRAIQTVSWTPLPFSDDEILIPLRGFSLTDEEPPLNIYRDYILAGPVVTNDTEAPFFRPIEDEVPRLGLVRTMLVTWMPWISLSDETGSSLFRPLPGVVVVKDVYAPTVFVTGSGPIVTSIKGRTGRSNTTGKVGGN